MYRSAIIGVSGPRANEHAEAYAHIERATLVAASTRNEENLKAFVARHGVEHGYTDYRKMFAEQKPDIVHVNTPPNVRVEVLEAAIEHGISAIIFEKPIALSFEDLARIRELDAQGKCKVAVNHQLHFHPNRFSLQEKVANGAIGKVTHVDVSSRLNVVHQGTHVLQAIAAFIPGSKAVSVKASASGIEGLVENPRHHYAPDQVQAEIVYDNGVQATLTCGPDAPSVDGAHEINHHKRIAVKGTEGELLWSMWGWQLTAGGVESSGKHDYFEEDILGQAAMVESMINWIEDDTYAMPLCLDNALADFEIVMGMYQSNWPELMAGAMLGIIPLIIVFVMCQRYFVKGIQLGAVKG